jgi:type III restriction enzyme
MVAQHPGWREYREQLAPLEKKPILFVMLGDKKEADDVARFLRASYPDEFGDNRTLLLRTNDQGEIVHLRELEKARKAAAEVDSPNSPINAIVSVLMLREGWDVQNVTVIVGLRPFRAKAEILPEQAIGRGLRLMFRDRSDTSYIEQVDILGNNRFLEFVDSLERIEQFQMRTFNVSEDRLKITVIRPDPQKIAYDIAVPQLPLMFQRRRDARQVIQGMDVMSMQCPPFPRWDGDNAAKTFRYEGMDWLTLKELFAREYTLPAQRNPQELIKYYTEQIAQRLQLSGVFHVLAPKITAFLKDKAFGEPVELDDPGIMKALNEGYIFQLVRDIFSRELSARLVEEVEPPVEAPERLISLMEPFTTRSTVYEPRRCVLNLVPWTSNPEYNFIKFLDRAPDVAAFCKLPDEFGFEISYLDTNLAARIYRPDFVVRLTNGEQWIAETKGLETPDVAPKRRAAELWCENATRATGKTWKYLLVPKKLYEQGMPGRFADLVQWGLWEQGTQTDEIEE